MFTVLAHPGLPGLRLNEFVRFLFCTLTSSNNRTTGLPSKRSLIRRSDTISKTANDYSAGLHGEGLVQLIVMSLCLDAASSVQMSLRFVCLFVCLGFNGTFSTNRLYHAITVG